MLPGQAAAGAQAIILVSLDTLRPDALGHNGHPEATSPFLDALAKGSLVFTAAQSTAPWTLPSHASAFTGQFASRHGATEMRRSLPLEAETLAEILAAEGWRTGAVVTSPMASRTFQLDQGFQFFQEVDESRPEPWREAATRAANWLADDDPRPALLFLHLYTVHQPFRPSEPYGELLPPEGPVRPKLDDFVMPRGLPSENLPAEDIAYMERRYLAEVRELDAVLRNFWARATAAVESPVGIFFSDHGEAFGEHGNFSHSDSVHEETMAIALMLHGPGIEAGLRANAVGIADIFPTVLDLAGIERPPGPDSRSLLAPPAERLLPGGTLMRDRLFATAIHEQPAKPARWKLHREARHRAHWDRIEYRLFDLLADPGELANLALQDLGRLALAEHRWRQALGEHWTGYPPGWLIQLNAARPTTFELLLEAEGGFRPIAEIHPGKAASARGASLLSGAAGGMRLRRTPKTLRISEEVDSGTALVFVSPVEADARVQVAMGFDGRAALPQEIALGPEARSPEGLPFVLTPRDTRKSLLPRQGEARFHVWRYPGDARREDSRPVTILDKATKEKLRSLGYIE